MATVHDILVSLLIFSVRELDEDVSVDVIMLFDYDPSILYMQDVIQSKKKKLIKWGERTKNSTKVRFLNAT